MNDQTAPLADDANGWPDDRIDWAATLRLALVAGLYAAVAAVLLAGHFSESIIVVTTIVLATIASWYQLERPPLRHALTSQRRR